MLLDMYIYIYIYIYVNSEDPSKHPKLITSYFP